MEDVEDLCPARGSGRGYEQGRAGHDEASAPTALVSVVGEGHLPSMFDVDALALGAVAAAGRALAELHALRAECTPPAVRIDRGRVAAAFRSERLLTAIGWVPPPIWDPIAGDYATRDGFVRIHTNYADHRAVALRVLSARGERDAVAAAVATWEAEALEAAIVDAGGVAARMRTVDEWDAHPQGVAVAAEPLVDIAAKGAAAPLPAYGGGAPLSGMRVLDLTRVIAGPVCTRVLAAYGADVLRVDPPGFAEVAALLPEVTAGKKRAALDLRSTGDRAKFQRLVATADMLVVGLRSDALARLDLGIEILRSWNPSLAVVLLDAYGWSGPWRRRRGFDSLVQMSSGIAARGGKDGRPGALPAQALDHGAGYLLAAAACRALIHRQRRREATVSRSSLARLARWLVDRGDGADAHRAEVIGEEREAAETAFGRVRRVPIPIQIEGIPASWSRSAGALGVDPPAWD